MKKNKLKLISKEDLYCYGRIWRLNFEAPGIEAQPGQFVNIEIEGKYLRRPISVSEYDGNILSLVVQIVGDGTYQLVKTPEGRNLDILTGLGSTFNLPSGIDERSSILVIGGGVGYAPLVGLLKKLHNETDCEILTVFGFNTEADVPLYHIQEFREEGYDINYCTMTGEMGDRGNALEVIKEYIEDLDSKPAYFYTCGPMGMMRAVCKEFEFEGELSLEARMGCGFGACMGCSILTRKGARRICKEGPVFKSSDIIW